MTNLSTNAGYEVIGEVKPFIAEWQHLGSHAHGSFRVQAEDEEGARLQAYHRLVAAPKILARFDDDAAGGKYLPRLAALSQCVAPVQVPAGKDVNAFYVMGDFHRDPIRQWLMEVCR